ncbi:hypothetical protein [Olivibacter jilunii]|uniref:hypothetical protein n=1 Tax=Olivibacter jilunii TaxID=985016 RepID=UPI003F5CDEE0
MFLYDYKNDDRSLLLGLLLILAILDHTRMFFHYWNTDPADITQSAPLLFFTRFLSHFFAPAVFLIVGTYCYQKKCRYNKGRFGLLLLRQGLALIFIEIFINNFLYTFDFRYRTLGLFILGLLGVSFIGLAALHAINRKLLLCITLLIIGGHNLLDSVHYEGKSFESIIGYILHQQKFLPVGQQMYIVNYTWLPWMSLLWLGFYFGSYYEQQEHSKQRTRVFRYIGWFSLLLFALLRVINGYGEQKKWTFHDDPISTILSFFNLTKYPASLCFLALTMGSVFLFLGYIKAGNRGHFFRILAFKPLFTYLISTFLIHATAMLTVWFQGLSPMAMVITPASYTPDSELNGYGFPLGVVYILCALFSLVLYYICKVVFENMLNRRIFR